MNNEQLVDELPEDGTQLAQDLTASLETAVQPTGPCCDKCGTPLSAQESLVCQKCGWYASIGSYVEIDRSWEVATSPELATEEDTKPAPKAALPVWAWILGACVVAVVVESVVVRLLTPDGGAMRTMWSLSQLFLGFVIFGICHTYSFVLVMRNEADIKLLDYLLRPIKSWSMIFRDLPARGWACYAGMSGLTAVVMSLLVIGGIPTNDCSTGALKKKRNSA